MTRLLVVLIASLVAASCANKAVRSNVAVTHALPAMSAAKTIAIVPYTESLAASPDYQSHTAKLAAHLQQKGYTIVAPTGGPAPDYLAFFLYRIDGGTPVNTLEGRAAPATGSIITYGLRTAFSTSTRRLYMRAVTVEIVDRARYRPNEPASLLEARVYSGSVVSDGPCSTMAPVIDPMLTALFANFPGQSGGIRTVDIPADTGCGLDRLG
jgi:hypothetical protein